MEVQVNELEAKMKRRMEAMELGQGEQLKRIYYLEEKMVREIQQQGEGLMVRMAEILTAALSRGKRVVEEVVVEHASSKGNPVQSSELIRTSINSSLPFIAGTSDLAINQN